MIRRRCLVDVFTLAEREGVSERAAEGEENG